MLTAKTKSIIYQSNLRSEKISGPSGSSHAQTFQRKHLRIVLTSGVVTGTIGRVMEPQTASWGTLGKYTST